MSTDQFEVLRQRFRKVFEAKWDRSELANFDDLQEKFSFHMADVAQHFGELAQAYASPSACDTKCLVDRTEIFFNHCMPHLIAAAQIYDEIPQVFEEQKGVHDWDSFIDDKIVS